MTRYEYDQHVKGIKAVVHMERIRIHIPRRHSTESPVPNATLFCGSQSIVIDDAFYERYIHSTDVFQQYICPGGCLPCPRVFKEQAEAAGLLWGAYHFGTYQHSGAEQAATDNTWATTQGVTLTRSFFSHLKAKLDWSRTIQDGVSSDLFTGGLTYTF